MAHSAKTIDLPAPQPRSRGLFLDAAFPLPDTTEGGVARWGLSGVTWVPWGCDGLTTGPSGCDIVDNKVVGDYEGIVSQPPFLMYDGIQCSTLSSDPVAMDRRLARNLEVYASAAFAEELITAAASGGTSFAGVATLVGPTATTVGIGLAKLETFLASRLYGAEGMIHMPPAVLLIAVGGGYVTWFDNQWRTPSGHVVTGDAGYVGIASPSGGAAANGVDQFWVYASGPVYYAITETVGVGNRNEESRIINRNIDRFLGERYGIVAFEPCAVGATKVALSTPV